MSLGVVNGQLANQTSFNDGFMSRKDDTDTVGVVDFKNTLTPASGPHILNIQRIVNSFASIIGCTTAEAYNALLTWSESYVGSNPSSAKDKIQALANLFHGTTGHAHTGANGDAKQVSSFDLSNFNKFFAEWQKISVTGATGSSVDITSLMGAKNPGGDSTTVGVITSGVYNKTVLLKLPKNDQIEDSEGQIVYGRITFSGITWTLSLYTNEAGVETSHTLAGSTDFDVYFLEVYNSATRPTIPSSPMMFGSLDITADVVDATTLLRGLVNTLAQSFAGNKTFTGITTVSNTTQSTTKDDGSLVLEGGLGVEKNVNVGGNANVAGTSTLQGQVTVTDTTQSTSKDTGSIVTEGGLGVEKNAYVGGNLVVEGDLTVNGTTTTLNTATLDVEDQNITVNKNGNDVSAQGAGLTVERTGTHGSIAYDSALASRFKCGDLASESEIINSAATQTLSGQKTYSAKQTFNSQLVFDEETNGASTGADATLPTPAKFYHTLTNASLTSIRGVTALTKQSFVLINKTGGTVVLKYDTGLVATDGMLNGAGSDIPMRDGSSLFFVYSPQSNRWIVLGAFVSSENKNEAIAAAGSFTKPTGFSASYLASSTGGTVDTSTTPLGTVAPPADGTEVTFTGFHATNLVNFLSSPGTAKGFVLNGDCLLRQYATLKVKWISTLDRWVEVSRSQYGLT